MEALGPQDARLGGDDARRTVPRRRNNFTRACRIIRPPARFLIGWGRRSLPRRSRKRTRTRCIILLGRPAYDGPGALPPEGRKQVDDYLTKAYTGFHGDTSGLAELKAQAKSAAVPPAGFKIEERSRDLDREGAAGRRIQQEQSHVGASGKQHEDRADDGRGLLRSDEGRQAAEDCTAPLFRPRPKEIVLALSDATTPEVTLKFETPVKADAGSSLQFEGVGESFTKEPFMLTLTAEKADVEGLSAAPAEKAGAFEGKASPAVISGERVAT